jgi:hypothetical protein
MTTDVCNAILLRYTGIINARSNNNGGHAPAFDRGNIDGGGCRLSQWRAARERGSATTAGRGREHRQQQWLRRQEESRHGGTSWEQGTTVTLVRTLVLTYVLTYLSPTSHCDTFQLIPQNVSHSTRRIWYVCHVKKNVSCDFSRARTISLQHKGIEYNTLAARGLEELFSSCAVVSVFGSGGK